MKDHEQVLRKVLTDYLLSIGKSYPAYDELIIDLEHDFHLPPNSRQRELVCHRISEELFCASPTSEMIAEWREFFDLYLYYLSRGCVQE